MNLENFGSLIECSKLSCWRLGFLVLASLLCLLEILMRCLQYFPCVAKSIASSYWTDEGEEPDATCRFDLDEGKGTKRDFFLASPLAFAASSGCKVLEPHFGLLCEFAVSPWTATSSRAAGLFLSPLLAGTATGRSSTSSSAIVQDIGMFTLAALMAALVEQNVENPLDCLV